MSTTGETTIRELDHRRSDGIDVRLLWSGEANRVWIDVHDDRLGGSFRVEVERGDALAAFRHPYAYVVPESTDHAVAA